MGREEEKNLILKSQKYFLWHPTEDPVNTFFEFGK